MLSVLSAEHFHMQLLIKAKKVCKLDYEVRFRLINACAGGSSFPTCLGFPFDENSVFIFLKGAKIYSTLLLQQIRKYSTC